MTDVAPGGREILLENYPREYLLVESTGSLLWTFRPDEGVLPSGDRIRLSRDGKTYLAWDSHREQGTYVVQWRVNERLVRKELPQLPPSALRRCLLTGSGSRPASMRTPRRDAESSH